MDIIRGLKGKEINNKSLSIAPLVLCYWLTHHTGITLACWRHHTFCLHSKNLPSYPSYPIQCCILLRGSHWSDFPVNYLTLYFFLSQQNFTNLFGQPLVCLLSPTAYPKSVQGVYHNIILVKTFCLSFTQDKLEAKQWFHKNTNSGKHFSNSALILFNIRPPRFYQM